jgi:SnoaL-like polyketide cyclase
MSALILAPRLRDCTMIEGGSVRRRVPERRSRMAAENERVVRRLFEDVWNKGEFGLLEDMVDPGYRSHIPEASVARMSRWTGSPILRVEIAAYRSGLPDLRVDLTTLVAGPNDVVVFCELAGKNTGRMVIEPLDDVRDEQIDPTGKQIQASGTARFRIAGGKVTEAQLYWYPLGPLDQIRLFSSGRLNLRVSEHDVAVRLTDAE